MNMHMKNVNKDAIPIKFFTDAIICIYIHVYIYTCIVVIEILVLEGIYL